MKRIEHREEKYPFCFVEYAPEKAADSLPLIIQLHGAGERGDDLSLVDVHGFSKLVCAKDYPCRILASVSAGTFWAAGRDVTYTRADGVGHNVWEQAYTEELLLWLLSKSK